MFKRLASFCYEKRRLVVITWFAMLIGVVAACAAVGGKTRTEFRLPGSESQQAFDILKAKGFADRGGESARIVWKADQGVNDPTVKSTMQKFFSDVVAAVDGATIVSPYDQGNQRQISQDGKIAYAELNLTDRPFEQFPKVKDEVLPLYNNIKVSGLQVELGSDIFITEEQSPSEIIGIIGAVIILLISFGSLLAMGLPIMTALFGIGCGIALGGLAANFLKMPSFTSQLTAMIGIGVGIDYALFMVTRYRQSLHDGMNPKDAISRALDTSGRAVLFAGTTVIISLYGMFAMKLSLFSALSVAASLGVLMTMLASLTLLPAVLGFVGTSIDKWSLPWRAKEDHPTDSIWYRWSRFIQKHPWPPLIAGLAVLLLLAFPVFSIRFGFADAGNRRTTDTTRRAYDLLGQGFGPGFNGPFLLVAVNKDGNSAVDLPSLTKLSTALKADEDVQFVSDPIPNKTGDVAIIQLYPKTSPQDVKTEQLVSRLRDHTVPDNLAGTNTVVKVSGLPPGAQDFASYTLSKLPIVMGSVLVLSYLLLMTVFRSVVVPAKAVIMNLLSIGAAYGVIVMVFQWGWGKSIIGVSKEGPIEAWVPLMLYAITFGLSMDYEVFLLSRIKEEYDRTHNNATAVADGLAATARVITAAAAIMVCVFLSFVLGDDRGIKLFGLGLAVAVFIDATIVRMILVPATMELLGDFNWWMPKWLNKILPKVNVESEDLHGPQAAGAPAGGGGGGGGA